MNQIICTSNITLEIPKKYYRQKIFLQTIFYSLVILATSFTIYYIYFRYDINKSEKFSKELLKDFNMTSLYTNNSSYSVSRISKKETISPSDDISNHVIGIIEIPKLNLVYPILSDINKDFLKVSACRFYGPNPNTIGNMCIAAHNYKNGTFFSNISKLVNGDIITIIDLTGSEVDYIVYNVYTAFSQDTSCIDQNTNNKRIITLVT